MKKHLLPSHKTPYTERAIELANTQLEALWLPDEIKVEKDIQDILVNMTPAEYHGVVTTLKLFTIYELFAGDEYWGSRFKKIFPDDPAMHRLASVNSAFELAIHAPFYKKLNEKLGLDVDDFYESYVNDPILKARMEFISGIIENDDDLVSLAGFSLVEGGILYSAFGYLKHFQSQGKNKLLNVVRGINFSVRDENLHSIGGAWAFKLKKQLSNLSPEAEKSLHAIIIKLIHALREHEYRIADMVFEKGHIDGITVTQMYHFIDSRLDICLEQIGYEKLFKPTYNPIAEYFYTGINNYSFNDFFSGMGASYSRKWDEGSFVYKTYNKEV